MKSHEFITEDAETYSHLTNKKLRRILVSGPKNIDELAWAMEFTRNLICLRETLGSFSIPILHGERLATPLYCVIGWPDRTFTFRPIVQGAQFNTEAANGKPATRAVIA